MQTIGYWDAWWAWWHGRSLAGYEMWGLPTLWWGRIGKLLQFAGGLIAVLDLIGPARLARLQRALLPFARQVREIETREGTRRLGRLRSAVTVILLGVAVLVGIGSITGRVLAIIAAGMAGLALLWGFLAGVLYVFVVLIGAQRGNHPVRWVAFLIIVVGFQFDLLAS
ncbi:hypothetical protein [Amycolatopsis sp. NPDC006125]|uniref:hypothetical protein n=1 Tax=Amycolatopsis sp. NPDC006125 TaxID=3156730 RepID=UPI0033B88AB8